MFDVARSVCLIVAIAPCGALDPNPNILSIIRLLEESSLQNQSELQLATIVSHPFEQNSYVARLATRTDCIVVDPGLEPGKIINYLQKNKLTPAAILNTHGHSDHIGGNQAVKERWPECRLVIGAGDAPMLTDAWLNLSANFGVPIMSPPADVLVRDGDIHEAAGFALHVREIPGHTVGHVVYLWEGQTPPLVFVGDVIFSGSIGRTDFPDGDHQRLLDGIRAKLFTLPGETILLSGHGESTTVEEEMRNNPFLRL
jgi:glyoxylase-like metal-dependent hydrolase (beta-lactamase superfamily II)